MGIAALVHPEEERRADQGAERLAQESRRLSCAKLSERHEGE
jgi:hypothetical protein